MVFVAIVDELQITIPVLKYKGCVPASKEKFRCASARITMVGTAVSAGKDEALWIWMYCADPELYP